MNNTIGFKRFIGEKGFSRTWLIIGIVTVVLAGGGFIVSRYTSNSLEIPGKLAVSFTDNLARQKNQEAYLMLSDEAKNYQTFEQFQESIKASNGENLMSYVNTLSYGDHSATISTKGGVSKDTVTGMITWIDGTTSPFQVDLVTENGIWKIHGFAVSTGK